MNNLSILPSEIHSEQIIIQKKQDFYLSKNFQIQNLEKLTPNDFYLKFKKLFLNSNEEGIKNKINEIQEELIKQDFYNLHLFFIKYSTIQFEEDSEKIIFFTKELFDKSPTLDSFLHNLSVEIFRKLYPLLENYNKNGFNRSTYTTENILISPSTNEVNSIFGMKTQKSGKKLLFECIKHFTITRGLNFPKILKQKKHLGVSISETNTDIMSVLMGFEKEKIINQNFPNATNFIIAIIKRFHKQKCSKNDFTPIWIGNMLALYFNDNSKYLSFIDSIEIVKEALKIKDSSLYYMLSTEGDVVSTLIKLIEKHNIKDINNIEKLHKLYTEQYIDELISRGYNIHLNNTTNQFYTSKDDVGKIADNILNRLSPKNTIDKTKVFLGTDDILLLENKTYQLEAKGSIKKLYESELSKKNEIIISQDSTINEIQYIKNIIITQFKGVLFKLKKADDTINIETKEQDKIINIYKNQIKYLLEKGEHKYNELLYGYEKHFLPIGGKLHFSDSLTNKKVREIKDAFFFSSTPFQLQHANSSMLLPPCESPFQLIEILNKLSSAGVIKDGKLELQLSIAGRLTNELSGILGSSMIFLKNYQITYPKEAFETSHNNMTGSCIVCYDAGVMETEGFSNIGEERVGRTDILGTKKIEEVVIFSIIGNLLTQAQFGGVHEKAGKEFIKEYKELLEKYNIKNILDGKWVHNPDGENSKPKEYLKHSKLVNTCTKILNESITQANKFGNKNTLIFELRDLVGKYVQQNGLFPTNLQEKKAIT